MKKEKTHEVIEISSLTKEEGLMNVEQINQTIDINEIRFVMTPDLCDCINWNGLNEDKKAQLVSMNNILHDHLLEAAPSNIISKFIYTE